MIETGRPLNVVELLKQIGMMNVYAISGGRVHAIINDAGEEIAVELPVGHGYRVTIELAWDDTYTVKREYVRKGTVFNKGTVENVYCDEIGEIAYLASCFQNVEFGKVEINA